MEKTTEINEMRISGNTIPYKLSSAILRATENNNQIALMGIGPICVDIMINALIIANQTLHSDESSVYLFSAPEYAEGDMPETTCIYLPLTHKKTLRSIEIQVTSGMDPGRITAQIIHMLEKDRPKNFILISHDKEGLYSAIKSLIYLNNSLHEQESKERAYFIPILNRDMIILQVIME